jgi:integrase
VQELVAALGSDRDRALVGFYLSSGVRPSELIGLTNDRVDPGNQLIGVFRKGSRDLQFVPAAPEAFVWLRLYQARLPEECCRPGAPVWWTLRGPYRPLTYHAARAMFPRVNAAAGTNWTLHDLRHTAATWMADDPAMPLTEIRDILGHASVTTTQIHTVPRREDVIAHARAHFARRDAATAANTSLAAPQPGVRLDYDSADLDELFGGEA